MTDELRHQAAVAVATWITETQGEPAAQAWVWECTPMPCGLPSDDQLDEGLAVACGELPISAVIEKSYREMDEAMAEWRASPQASNGGEEKPK